MGIPLRELETESEASLRSRYDERTLSASILAGLRADAFSSFEVGFELAARLCAPQENSEALHWLRRYLDSGRGVPDAVPWWDVASRQWLLKLARLAPDFVERERATLADSHQRLADFCLAVACPRPLPDEVGQAVARHYLNASPGCFVYADLIGVEELARSAEQLLTQQAFPILRRERVEELVAQASDELLLELCVNYCGQDFRSFSLSLLKERPKIDLSSLERRASRDCSPEGSITLALAYTRKSAAPLDDVPPWVSQGLLLDLRSGSSEDVSDTLDALLALQPSYARSLLVQALREDRAVLMVPALADAGLLKQFLARIAEGLVDRETAIAALRRCGDEGLNALLDLANVKRPAAGLASVVAEALAHLLGDEASVSHYSKRAAELLVPWLGHSSKGVTAAARRTLEQLGETARDALQAGLAHDRTAVRAESARLLERLRLWQPTPVTPLDLVRERAIAQGKLAVSFLQACDELLAQPERWSLMLLPQVRKHGAVCLEWLRPWFEHHVQHGDVRLWCYVVELLAQDDEATWVAVDTFARAPKLPTSLWARPRRALTRLGPRLAQPVAFVLAHVNTEYREPLYRLLAMHPVDAPLPMLLAGLTDESKPIRSHAVDALSRLPWTEAKKSEVDALEVEPATREPSAAPDVLTQVLSLLRSSNPGARTAVAELLAVWGKPQAREALITALHEEKRSQVRVYLEEALVAVGARECVFHPRLESGELPAAVSPEVIEAFLDARSGAIKVPRFLALSPPPALSFRHGGKLSDTAHLGFVALASQLDATLKGRVLRQVADCIEPHSLAAWSRHVYERWLRSKDIKFKWALYQLWVLADDALIAEAGAELGTLRAHEHATVSCYLRVLQWRSSKGALDWLVHWGNALPSRGLRELAGTLLRRVAHKTGVAVTSLIQQADPWVAAKHFERHTHIASSDARGQEQWKRHLEQSLLTGQSWTFHEWQKLSNAGAALLQGLLWVVEPKDLQSPQHVSAKGQCVLFDGQQLVDEEERPLTPEAEARLRLAHPLDLEEAELDAWRERLQALNLTPGVEQVQRPHFIYEGARDLILAELDTDSERFDAWLRKDRWFHGEPLDHGIVYSNTRRIAPQRLVFRIEHSGYPIGRHEGAEAIEVRTLQVFDLMGNPADFADVPARTYSELCLSLSHLRRPSGGAST